MNAFETAAILDDALHLTLREPAPATASRECRVIVLFDMTNGHAPSQWPAGFFDEIRIRDSAFERPAQGSVPAMAPLDA
jgi:hypothetical protein